MHVRLGSDEPPAETCGATAGRADGRGQGPPGRGSVKLGDQSKDSGGNFKGVRDGRYEDVIGSSTVYQCISKLHAVANKC